MNKRISDWIYTKRFNLQEKNEGSDYEANGSDHEKDKDGTDDDVDSDDFEDDDDSDDFNPFGSGSEDDDPWAKKSKKKKQKIKKKAKKNGSAKEKKDPFEEKYAHLFQQQKPKVENKKPPVSNLPGQSMISLISP